jgi:hypothetical protein
MNKMMEMMEMMMKSVRNKHEQRQQLLTLQHLSVMKLCYIIRLPLTVNRYMSDEHTGKPLAQLGQVILIFDFSRFLPQSIDQQHPLDGPGYQGGFLIKRYKQEKKTVDSISPQ